MAERWPEIKNCPICGGKPLIEECEPWDRKRYGKPPWSAGCYKTVPFEHFVGINGDSAANAIFLWNIEVEKVATLAAHPADNIHKGTDPARCRENKREGK